METNRLVDGMGKVKFLIENNLPFYKYLLKKKLFLNYLNKILESKV